MDYTEAHLRIVKNLSNDFLSNDKNREALQILESLFATVESKEMKTRTI